jgi:hypothetical protein
MVALTNPLLQTMARFIVFESEASNWVPMDTNATCINGAVNMTCRDVFIYEVATGLVERVSVTTEGVEGNGASFGASSSGDGTTIVFASSSNNLVAGDTNGNAASCYTPHSGENYCYDIFLHHRTTGETRRISLNNDGSQFNGSSTDGVLSPDGEFAVFFTLAPEITPNCSSCPTMLRLDLETQQWESLGAMLGRSRMDVTPRAQQIGYSTVSIAYRTCDPDSQYCLEAAVWDATNRPYVVPLPACSGYPRPDTPASAPSRGAYSVYLPMTRNSCRAGNP